MKKILFSLLLLLVLVAVPLAQTNPAVSTTLAAAVDSSATTIRLASASGIVDNYGLYIDGELMTVNPSWTSGVQIPVTRGQMGTVGRGHISGSTVIIGPPGMFTNVDAGPGVCPATPQQYLVSVNVISGNVWFCQGGNAGTRIWRATNTRQLTYNSLTIA